MMGVLNLLFAIWFSFCRNVYANEVDRHHNGVSKPVEVHTHSVDKVSKHSVKHGKRSHDKHRGGNKSGILAQNVSLLEAGPSTVNDIAAHESGNKQGVLGTSTGAISTTVNTGAELPVSPNTVPSNSAATTPAPSIESPNTATPNGNLSASGTVSQDNQKPSNSKGFACTYLWFLYDGCDDTTSNNDTVTAPQNNGTSNTNDDDLSTPPVISNTCTIYGTTIISLSDFKDAEEGGWIMISDSNTPKITHNKQVNLDKPAQLPLKATLCNAANYEATIKLGVDSIGGFIIRGSEQDFVVFEMNTLSKTATLKSVNGAYQDIITEVSCDQINSQFVQKVQINDSGYKGQIEILIDGRKIMNVTRMPYKTSGFFGLYISQGNATFGDISVVPMNS
ncbi:putative integral membrane protein [Babesia bovis T2Bo]|uniref:putative integral membrane protein n=1 Tax=Babesia bovis T2Bo TaxID=484906 RepID=UPI001DD9B426|nr:putative integral membrane protein [Babesia bovis T2Bo]EDO07391.2 putative integral membrane protein [Babesia bovis T2Bo]